MEEIKVVKAVPEDAEKILAYSKIIGGETDNLTYGPEGISATVEQEKEMIRKRVDSDRQAFFVAKYGDEVVGIADFSSVEHPRIGHRGSMGISVRKDMWGKGVGSMLMEHIIDFAKNVAKVDIVALQVRSDNERAIHLYEKFGFEKFGTFKGFLKIRGEHIDFDFMNLYL
ncbi:MAG: GNAT family N-acetyltransferase [Roseburia sp.]|nr:GNAT family N-acetyltransferase [Roseburia sp.]